MRFSSFTEKTNSTQRQVHWVQTICCRLKWISGQSYCSLNRWAWEVVASKLGGNNTKIQGTVVRFHCYPVSRNQPCKWPPTSNVKLKELQWRNLPNPNPNTSNFSLAEWNEISEKCFSHTLLGPGYRSCDLCGGQLFLLRPPLPTFPPTHPNIWSFYIMPV